ncbi:GntR family transcriptional regulator [Fodinisporobacter ferrooxydans]|uniref:GntR family transcriptional regulator n=1 Tax=Fodinisporobacter ferrooxydans TaxID=2901836 RepID=A0ABY4CPI1_9BACL|nr:GntR family transcriptional regulator [Alicyclobacillaceae bacterium MYW30-H2]
MDLPKIDNSNLWDKTYNVLKDKIIRRGFNPNQKLSIQELAEQLGVSRTPIRDALNRLETEGLIRTISKVGTFVRAIDVNDVIDIMDTRLMLEFWVVDKLHTLSKHELNEAIRKMEDILEQTSKLIETPSLNSFLDADYNLKFHIEFIKLGKNKNNIDIYQKVMEYRFLAMESSLISKDMVLTAIEQHSSIVDALKEGEITRLKYLIKVHLDDSKEKLIDKIQKNGGTI